MIDSVCDNIQPDIIATDGDAMRRKVLNGRDKLIKDKDIRTLLGKLPLFHLHIIDGQYALYFDDKHNAKRLRCILISCSRGCMVGKNIISQSQLKYVFDAADIRNTKEILSPNDRQSVTAVLNSFKSLEACIIFQQNSDDQVCCELLGSLKILEKIFDGIVCVFRSPKIHYRTLYITNTKHVAHHLYLRNFTMIYREWYKQVSIYVQSTKQEVVVNCICTN